MLKVKVLNCESILYCTSWIITRIFTSCRSAIAKNFSKLILKNVKKVGDLLRNVKFNAITGNYYKHFFILCTILFLFVLLSISDLVVVSLHAG